MKHLDFFTSPITGKKYDLRYSETAKRAQAVGPLPTGEGVASVGSVGIFVEVSAETEKEARKLLAEAIEEKERKTKS